MQHVTALCQILGEADVEQDEIFSLIEARPQFLWRDRWNRIVRCRSC
ncbi:hypothetical protein [Mesorhizobium sophorae]|nr:hypothetical protein [Mesorhizobium sophorae]